MQLFLSRRKSCATTLAGSTRDGLCQWTRPRREQLPAPWSQSCWPQIRRADLRSEGRLATTLASHDVDAKHQTQRGDGQQSPTCNWQNGTERVAQNRAQPNAQGSAQGRSQRDGGTRQRQSCHCQRRGNNDQLNWIQGHSPRSCNEVDSSLAHRFCRTRWCNAFGAFANGHQAQVPCQNGLSVMNQS